MNEVKVNMENLTDEQQKQLMKLIEIANIPQRTKLEFGDKYYFINEFAETSQRKYYNSDIDDALFNSRNAFLTQEEAEFQVEKRKIITELQNYADEHNENKIDWNNFNQNKWSFYFDYEYEVLKYSVNERYREQNSIYFTSDIICNEAIKSVGEDRIKKYLFEVE